MIHQKNQLIQHYSAMRNVLMGRIPHRPTWRCLFPWSDKDKRIALDCLDSVGRLKKARTRITQLNKRQQQLVNIARALAQKPNIILADGLVGGFDPTTSEELLALLKKVCEEQ
jgi:phosphonate transport system ATP-binding protein